MKYAIPLTFVAIILAAGTYVEGTYSDRWSTAGSEKLDHFTIQVPKIPLQIGDWEGVDDQGVSKEEFKKTDCTAFISRMYRSPEGQQVNVYLVSGTGRHTTIHTPDWCYVGAGYEKVDDPQQYRIQLGETPSGLDPEFLTTVFRKEDPLSKHEIRVFWTFSDDGMWQGPKDPKAEFGGRRAMYKIYFITDVGETGWGIETNQTTNFVKEFIPIANEILFQEPETASTAEDTTG